MFVKALIAAACCQIAVVAVAADIYCWVDERGRTHLSDTVPDRYKGSATRVDSKQFELTPTQRAQASAAAAKQAREAREAASAASAAATPLATARPPAAPASRADAAGPDCERLWRAYRESQECFAPYQRRNAGPPPEAFERCKEVASPEDRCGPSKW